MKHEIELKTLLRGAAMLICVLALAGCQTTATNCAGWKRPPVANNAANLVRSEGAIARYLVATEEFGKAQKCW